jgi:hypothetical protein
MRIFTASLLVFLVAGCTVPENPPDNPPVANPDPPSDTQTLPDDPKTVAKPPLDPVIRLKRLDAVLETDEQGNVLSITVSGPLIVDEILEQIGALESLVTLNIEYTEITDAGLAHLKTLSKLETLILRGTEITDEGLVHVEQLKTLTTLDVEFAPVSEEGVARLQKALPHCKINY